MGTFSHTEIVNMVAVPCAFLKRLAIENLHRGMSLILDSAITEDGQPVMETYDSNRIEFTFNSSLMSVESKEELLKMKGWDWFPKENLFVFSIEDFYDPENICSEGE